MVSMNNRAWTVGSLIPGSMIPEKVTPSISSNQEYQHLNKIIVLQNEKKFDIQPVKGNLLDTALNQGKALRFKCQKGTCGLCSVKIVEDGPGLSAPNEKEQKKLKKALNNGFRLACQVEIL